jgi:hypothetical protein
MKVPPLVLFLCTVACSAPALEPASFQYSRTIFSDDFSGPAFGERWGHYKSGSIVKDGVLVGITPENSDHAAVDHIRFDPEKDLEVSVRFRFASDKAKGFNVWFDDKNYKGSHAGHICSVTLNPTALSLSDAKTGNFQNDIYEKKKSPEGLSAEQKALLATKTKRLPIALSQGEWHTLLVRTKNAEVSVEIDGKPVGSFSSEGIAHDSKTLLSLTTNLVDVHYDDFMVRGVAKP